MSVASEILAMADNSAWKAEGLCRQSDADSFFPEKGGSTAIAKRVCQNCPVKVQCLTEALKNDERFGVWGGFSERERRRLKAGKPVTPSWTNKPNRKPNGHGHACKCWVCYAEKKETV